MGNNVQRNDLHPRRDYLVLFAFYMKFVMAAYLFH